MTGESGYVASEGFPNLYPPNKKCIWTITVRRPLWSPLLFISLPSQTLTAQGHRPHHQASPLGNPLFLFGPRASGPMVTCSEVPPTFLLLVQSHYWELSPGTLAY